jgi:peptide/nickel transport system permease protein
LFGVLLFALSLNWLPSSGYVAPGENPVEWAKSMIMPCVALAMPTIGTLSRVARASLLETLDEPYVQFARSKGISRWRLYVSHALKNASVPIVVVAGAEFAYILGDAVVVETVFSLPGLGKLMIDSFLNRDYAVIQGVALVYTVLVVISGLIADLVSARLDPRVRLVAQPA